MLWLLLWLVLVAAASAVTAYLGLRLFRQAKSLGAEGAAASARLSEDTGGFIRSVQPLHPPIIGMPTAYDPSNRTNQEHTCSSKSAHRRSS